METKNLKEAMFYEKLGDGKVKCLLCPHTCTIADNKVGICKVRRNIGGTLYATTYQKASAVAIDPIEKKPLFHFFPGSHVLSYGGVGCNLKCRYCQNHHISQATPDVYPLRNTGGPDRVLSVALRRACGGVAFTYNEPTVWYEFMYDTAKAVKEKGFYTAMVSNGYINPEPLKKLTPYIDAANIDIKSITEEDYWSMSTAHMDPVLQTVDYLAKNDVLVEITCLVVTGFNDTEEKIRTMARWIVDHTGPDTAFHLTRYHPDYLYTEPATSLDTLKMAYKVSKDEGLRYVYVGNTIMRRYANTYCHNCNTLVVTREKAYARKNYRTVKGKPSCPSCGTQLPFVDKAVP